MGTAKNAINKSINDNTNMYSINDNNVCNDNTNMFQDVNINEITIDYILENNLIEKKLIEILENENIETDLKSIININAMTFNYYFSLASKPFFYKTSILKLNDSNIYINNNINNGSNIYNWDAIIIVYDYFINICNKYHKYSMLQYFINFIHMDYDIFMNKYDLNNIYITDHGSNILNRFNLIKANFLQKIHNNQELYIESKLADSNNITGAIAIANKKFGYSDNTQKQPQITNNYINYNQLPDFSEKMPQIGQNNP